MAHSMFYDVLRVSLALNNITANLRRGGEQATMTCERCSYPVSTLGAAGANGCDRARPAEIAAKLREIEAVPHRSDRRGHRCRLSQRVDPDIF
jgi:hypothetical protein